MEAVSGKLRLRPSFRLYFRPGGGGGCYGAGDKEKHAGRGKCDWGAGGPRKAAGAGRKRE